LRHRCRNEGNLPTNSGGAAYFSPGPEFGVDGETEEQAIAFIPRRVTSIEGLFSHRSGAEQKDAVMSFLQTALSMTDAVVSNEIVDEASFRQGLSGIISGTLQCLNASVWAKAPAVTPASPGR